MKKLVLLSLSIFFGKMYSQEISFDVSNFTGYNISCNGAATGSIDATIVGGTAPITFSWSNGATTEDVTNLVAGSYTLTVTDAASHSTSKSVTLIEPDVLTSTLYPSLYEGGFNISIHGNNDGEINSEVSGGATPYSYVWNTNATSSSLRGLTAGAYSVTITDQNNCAINKNQTLTEPTTLNITSLTAADHNGHTISCYDGRDGSVTLAVSGAVPPYSYSWSNGSFEQNPDGMRAGDYDVQVIDANGAKASSSITLTEPNKLNVKLIASNFSGYNISCNHCNNGTLTTNVTGGTPAFTYQWSSTQTSANLTTLDVGEYTVIVTDANGCLAEAGTILTEPAYIGFDKIGNNLTSTDFLGSTNNEALVFKTNNTEAMRLTENGDAVFQKSLEFGGGGYCTYFPAIGGQPPVISVGPMPINPNPRVPPVPLPSCFTAPPLSILDHPGLFQSTDALNNPKVVVGYYGTQSIIESIQIPLNINALCGDDVYICNNNFGNVGIGTNTPNAKLDVFGSANIQGNENVLYDEYVNGKIGVGTTTPWSKLEVVNNAGLGSSIGLNPTFSLKRTGSGTNSNRIIIEPRVEGADYSSLSQPGDTGIFFTDEGGTGASNASAGLVIAPIGGTNGIRIDKDANVGIGTDLTYLSTSSIPFKLSVNGNIHAKRVLIETTWSDFVYEENYKLMTFKEYEDYYKKYHHLPHFPSAKEIETSGADVGELIKLQQQTIEEQSLYIIDLNKKYADLLQRIEKIEKK